MSLGVLHWKSTCGPFNRTLRVNEACLNVFSNFNVPLSFHIKSTECFKKSDDSESCFLCSGPLIIQVQNKRRMQNCLITKCHINYTKCTCDFVKDQQPVLPDYETSFIIDTNFGVESYFYDGKEKFCQRTNHFEDFGIYKWNISESGCDDIEVIQKPENLWINIGLSSCFFLGIFLAYWLSKFVFKHCQLYFSSTNVSLRELEMDLGSPNSREERKHRLRRQSRIRSIDAFRGLAIILMIFVNYGGGEYSVFKHSPWNGLTVADVVFPWFVWIMGASIVFSLRSSLRMSTSRRKIFCQILKRSLILIWLGIILNSGKRYKHGLRLPGVLQRLGITYLIVGALEIFIAKPQRNEQFGPWSYCQDVVDSWMQWLLAICFAVAHELLTFLLPVPGCPTGYLGPGGLSEHSMFRNCTGGAAGYIDRIIITDAHLYHQGTFVKLYVPPVAYDPEGLLGTLTSIFCAFLGVHAGRIILSFENPNCRIRQWLLWAVFTGITAGFLCSWTQDGGVIPVNKNLWSLSFVLACSSLAFLILTFFYCLIDFTHVWSGYPFVYPGMNGIILYLGHSLLKEQLPWRWYPYTNTHLELLIMDITATVVWIIIAYILHKKNIYLSI